jgi:BolA family transcriptional regulator, general stress-responsive regulator
VSISRAIHDKLVAQLEPVALEVINESRMHAVPKDSETHFKVIVVSRAFEGVPLVKRHRMVNGILADELRGGVHALSIHAYTPDQWTAHGGEAPKSPPCLGGSKAAP